MKTAILDLGSNSFHVVVYDIKKGNRASNDEPFFMVVSRQSVVNTLGSYILTKEHIPIEIVDASADLVQSLIAYAYSEGACKVHLFGTGVFRESSSKEMLLTAIEQKTNMQIDVLTPEREAKLVYKAVAFMHQLPPESLLVDIGGGSSELISASNGEMQWFRSIAMGTASFAMWLRDHEENDHEGVAQHVRDIFGDIVTFISNSPPAKWFGTAGFLRCIAMGSEEKFTKGSSAVDRATLEELRDEKVQSGKSVTPSRNEVIRTGAVMLLALMDAGHVDEITVLDASTREGYLFELMETGGV